MGNHAGEIIFVICSLWFVMGIFLFFPLAILLHNIGEAGVKRWKIGLAFFIIGGPLFCILVMLERITDKLFRLLRKIDIKEWFKK